MTISLNWLKQYIDVELSNEELKNLLTDIGLEVESMEPFESVKGGLKGLVVGHVLEKEKHPDADKLSVCKVDTGSETLQIVCGAPNVAAGQKVIVALVGTKLFPTTGEPFEIKKAKIRGVESSGMICAEDEIGLGSSHDGILILEESTPTGSSVADLFGVENDTVIEIGLTPNRTDAFSHIGVARDLAAAVSFRSKKECKVKYPDLNVTNFKSDSSIQIELNNQEACPRYAGIVIQHIKIADSPSWLKNRLKAIGQKPINNVVDITNFVLHEYGQPLHAFDWNEIKGNKVVVQNLPAKTKFITLDNNTIELHPEDLMICDGEGTGMCIGGIYGGATSGVKDSTTAIFLESAYFDPKTIRRTSTRHGLRTEAATHFEKGVDPAVTIDALKRAAQMIATIAGGEISSEVIDIKTDNFKSINSYFNFELSLRNLNRLTGVVISEADTQRILDLLDIRVEEKKEEIWTVLVPPYRTDVRREADVIEEIIRIYGVNNIPIPTKLNAAVNFSKPFDADKLYNKTADLLVNLGFFEMMNNSVTKSKHQSSLSDTSDSWVKLLSSINVELDVLRNNMLFTGLESVAHNINHKNSNVKLFEFGKTYHHTGSPEKEGNGLKQYKEENHLAIFVSGSTTASNWTTTSRKSDFYYLKSIVDAVLGKLGITDSEATDHELSDIFNYSLVYRKGSNKLVEFGKVHAAHCKLTDIKQEVYFADFNWDAVLAAASKVTTYYQEIAKYPAVKRDLALLLDKKVKFAEVKSIAEKFGKKILRNIELFDIYEDEKIGKDNKSYAVSFTFRDDTKTLQDVDIDGVMKKLMEQYQTQLNAVIR